MYICVHINKYYASTCINNCIINFLAVWLTQRCQSQQCTYSKTQLLQYTYSRTQLLQYTYSRTQLLQYTYSRTQLLQCTYSRAQLLLHLQYTIAVLLWYITCQLNHKTTFNFSWKHLTLIQHTLPHTPPKGTSKTTGLRNKLVTTHILHHNNILYFFGLLLRNSNSMKKSWKHQLTRLYTVYNLLSAALSLASFLHFYLHKATVSVRGACAFEEANI